MVARATKRLCRSRCRASICQASSPDAFAIVLLRLVGARLQDFVHGPTWATRPRHPTHSLFRQGCMLYELTPQHSGGARRPLIERFSEYVSQNNPFARRFSFV